MPSSSKKQRNFMAAVAHSPSFAKKAGVPQSVGQDFTKADKGKTFKQGGNMATKSSSQMKMAGGGLSAGHKSADGIAKKGKTKAKDIAMKKGGMVSRYDKGGEVEDNMDDMERANQRENLDVVAGPKAMPMRPISKTPTVSKPVAKRPSSNYSNEGRYKSAPAEIDETKMSVSDRIKASKAKSREGTTDTRSVSERVRSLFGMAKGGSTSSFRSSANGIAQRGKTRGKII